MTAPRSADYVDPGDGASYPQTPVTGHDCARCSYCDAPAIVEFGTPYRALCERCLPGPEPSYPVVSPRWQGETCCMCNGTGRDCFAVTEPTTGGCELVVGYVENGRACRACNGHGRDPSDD